MSFTRGSLVKFYGCGKEKSLDLPAGYDPPHPPRGQISFTSTVELLTISLSRVVRPANVKETVPWVRWTPHRLLRLLRVNRGLGVSGRRDSPPLKPADGAP